MKKLIFFVFFTIQTVISFAQTIEVYNYTENAYETTNLYDTDVYVKPGDTLTLKIIIDEGAVNNFPDGTGYTLGIKSSASFFTTLDSIYYSESTGGLDIYTFGSPVLDGNTGINQTLNKSGNASVDVIEIVNIDIKIPESLNAGLYDIQLLNDFISGINSPVCILTLICEKADISVENFSQENVISQTIKVQRGQTLNFDVSIVEPSNQNDFFSVTTTFNVLNLVIPTGFIFQESWNLNDLDFNYPSVGSAYLFEEEIIGNCIGINGNTIEQGVKFTGDTDQETLTIQNVNIEMSTDMQEGIAYPLQLAHDFIPGENSPIDLLYFEYVAPNVNVAIPQNEEDKPCVGGNEEFTLTDIPEDMEYYLVIDDQFITEDNDMVKVHNGDTYAFSLGDRVKVREKYMTDPFVESDEIVITAAYFKSMTIEAVSGDSVFCPGAPVDFRINTSCGSVGDFDLSFKPEGEDWTVLNPTPEIVDQSNYYAFTYIPPATARIFRVGVHSFTPQLLFWNLSRGGTQFQALPIVTQITCSISKS